MQPAARKTITKGMMLRIQCTPSEFHIFQALLPSRLPAAQIFFSASRMQRREGQGKDGSESERRIDEITERRKNRGRERHRAIESINVNEEMRKFWEEKIERTGIIKSVNNRLKNSIRRNKKVQRRLGPVGKSLSASQRLNKIYD